MAVGLAIMTTSVSHATKYWKNTAGSGNWNVSNNGSAISAADADNDGVPPEPAAPLLLMLGAVMGFWRTLLPSLARFKTH
jgi:hypothetical protein